MGRHEKGDGDDEDVYDEDEMEDEEDEDVKSHSTVTARPRRMSELNIPDKVKPIPKASSLFIFAPENK